MKAAAAPVPVSVEDTSVIEEVTAKQLERLLHDKDYVAVYWCKCSEFIADIVMMKKVDEK